MIELSGNAFVSGAGGLRFKFSAGQIGQSYQDFTKRELELSLLGSVLANWRNSIASGSANSKLNRFAERGLKKINYLNCS